MSGQAAVDASYPLAETPRGGMETGFDGTYTRTATNGTHPNGEEPSEFEGMGPWLEDDDKTVYQTANELVLRQELIAQNHLAQDTHYTRVKLGYPFSTLEKDQNRDTYRAVLPKGTKALSIQAVPNQAWDLVNKATEAVLTDPPQPDPAPLNDSEEASAAAEMAERFLTEDGGENGTNDIELFYQGVDRSLTCATSYLEGWVDPVGGGYVPLQILAHPQAVSPDNPMVGADGMPTTDPILRYVTAPQGGEFTNDPTLAAPQWQPKIRGTVWGREHWRVYPESATVQTCEKVIGLLYCTIGEAKRRWPAVAEMNAQDVNKLLDWTPPRYLVLLPPYQRARWKLSSGADKEKSGSSDERILFYYRVLQKASPDHPKGAEVIVSGAMGGKVIHKDILAATLEIPTSDGTGPKKEVRCMDVPLVQITPRSDPDERDPTGRCYMELFAGATEFDSALAAGYLEALDQWLHPDSYIPSTSSVQGFQVDESRATGDAIPILRPEDKPVYGNQPALPSTFFQAADWNDDKIRSIASLNKPVTGDDRQQEVSGKARQIAVAQARVGLNRMQLPVNSSFERWWRIKVQLSMKHFSASQTIRYVGEDGAYKESEWKGVDFALVGEVGVQSGTGTMMPPEQKVQYIANLMANQMLPPEEAADAARPTFAQRLGLPDDPHKQYIERCVTEWLKGPPPPPAPTADGMQQPSWVDQWRTYQAQKQQYDAVQAQANAMAQQQQAEQAHAETLNPTLPPSPPAAPAPIGPPPVAPWTPFQPRPNDQEPAIAAMWLRRLSKVMSTVKYSAMPPEWRQALDEKYLAAGEVARQAQLAAQPQPKPQVKPEVKPSTQEAA